MVIARLIVDKESVGDFNGDVIAVDGVHYDLARLGTAVAVRVWAREGVHKRVLRHSSAEDVRASARTRTNLSFIAAEGVTVIVIGTADDRATCYT